jgi:hypothetical protein
MSRAPIELDAGTLRRWLKVGGLEVSAERAATLLPAVTALLTGCVRLAALGLSGNGGSGPAGARED